MPNPVLTLCSLFTVMVIIAAQIAPTEIPTRWRWSQFPNPQNDPGRCGRNKPSYVCDPNRLVSFRGADAIDKIISQTISDRTCPCGTESCGRTSIRGYLMSVAIVPDFVTPYDGGEADRILLETRRFAYGIYHNQWNFGVCDEWVLLFFSQMRNIVYTLTGSLARATLTDSRIEEITMDARYYFAEGPEKNYTRGLLQMVEDYRNVFKGTYTRRPFIGRL